MPFGRAAPLNWDPYLIENLQYRRNVPNPEHIELSDFTCWRAFGDELTGLGGVWIRTTVWGGASSSTLA